MITAVFGNKNSGKSEFAEKLLNGFNGSKYYLATMRVLDEEDRAKVELHRKKREGKDFVTIEQDVAIVKAIDKIKWMESLLSVGEKERAVLLECIPTLIANEMFLPDGEIVTHEEVEKTILFGIAFLKEFFNEIVIVSEENDGNPGASVMKAVKSKARDDEWIKKAEDEYSVALDEINKAIRRFSERIENL